MIVEHFSDLLVSQQAIRPASIAIGVFDGLHKGHETILSAMKQLALETHSDPVVITFDRNPKMAKGTIAEAKPLMSRLLMEEFLCDMGIARLVMIDFSDDISKLSGEQFIAIVTKIFDVKAIVTGKNFRCGSPVNSAGPEEVAKFLKIYAPNALVQVQPDVLTDRGEVVSSTLIRSELRQGKVGAILHLLGREYEVDLRNIPFRITANSLLYKRTLISQLLPPPGAYEVMIMRTDGPGYITRAVLDEANLVLQPVEGQGKYYRTMKFLKEC